MRKRKKGRVCQRNNEGEGIYKKDRGKEKGKKKRKEGGSGKEREVTMYIWQHREHKKGLSVGLVVRLHVQTKCTFT